MIITNYLAVLIAPIIFNYSMKFKLPKMSYYKHELRYDFAVVFM